MTRQKGLGFGTCQPVKSLPLNSGTQSGFSADAAAIGQSTVRPKQQKPRRQNRDINFECAQALIHLGGVSSACNMVERAGLASSLWPARLPARNLFVSWATFYEANQDHHS